jgi:nitrogen fixation NifU-like protein
MDDIDTIRKEFDDILMAQIGPKAKKILEEHVINPKNAGYMNDPDGEASVTGICEDTVRIQIKVMGDKIEDIRFITNGCIATVACSSMATELAKGKTIQEAYRISDRDIDIALGGLPKEHAHCATLAANALRQSILDYIRKKKEPWKKIYRKNH